MENEFSATYEQLKAITRELAEAEDVKNVRIGKVGYNVGLKYTARAANRPFNVTSVYSSQGVQLSHEKVEK